MMNNGFTGNEGEFYAAPDNVRRFDNKTMVSPLPSSGNTVQQNVRINITDSDKKSTPAPSRNKSKRRIRLPYVINTFLSIIVFASICLLEFGYLPATKMGFYCKDPSLSYQFTGDTISATTLLVSNLLVVPLVILVFMEYLRRESIFRISWREIWFFYKEFMTGCALVLLLTEIGKVLVGEHRPHFFDVCRPDTAQNCTDGQFIKTYECTVTKYSRYFMSDTSRSFPSGHSSVSAFVAVCCSYVIQSKLPTIHTGQLIKPFLICCCLTWALVCSLTRITDRRHHWWDVAVGMLLGALTALYSLSIIRKRLGRAIPKMATSTTTLLDIKNKDAKSEVI